MDNELIFFLILAAISLVSNILNNRKKAQQKREAQRRAQQQTQTQPSSEETTPRRKPFSFEDLLKEFDTGYSERDQSEEEPTIYDYREGQERREERYSEPEPVKEVENEPEKSAYESYEGASYEKVDADSWKIDEPISKVKPVSDRLSASKKKEHEYAKLLKTKRGLKKAIILNEILNRKY